MLQIYYHSWVSKFLNPKYINITAHKLQVKRHQQSTTSFFLLLVLFAILSCLLLVFLAGLSSVPPFLFFPLDGPSSIAFFLLGGFFALCIKTVKNIKINNKESVTKNQPTLHSAFLQSFFSFSLPFLPLRCTPCPEK